MKHSKNRARGGGPHRNCATSDTKGKPIEKPPVIVSTCLTRASLSVLVLMSL